MNSVLDTIQTWARKARASAWFAARDAEAQETALPHADPLVYRLRSWPELPERQRTAPVLRLISTMSVRPVSRRWMVAQSRLRPREIDGLLASLSKGHALEVTDTSRLRAEAAVGPN